MGLFGGYKKRCKICMKEFKVLEEHVHHTKTLHPLEKPCTKCDGVMVIPQYYGVRLWRDGWQTEFDPKIASAYACEKCGIVYCRPA